MSLCTAGTEADEASMLAFADEAEQAGMAQSWAGLFWLPPVDDEPGERDMLRLDDELAGLLEAADTPAGQAGAHSTKPEPVVSVAGEVLAAHSKSAAVVPISHYSSCATHLLAYLYCAKSSCLFFCL